MEIPTQAWDRVKEVFDEAADLGGGEREAFLEAACRGEPELRSCLDSLLAVDGATSRWLRGSVEKTLFEAATAGPLEGKLLGPYRLLEEIGRGGMGTVYLAERADGEFQQQVAVKVITTGALSDELRRRFLVERQILARLDHPNIARLLDGGTTTEGLPFLAMEKVEGQRISDYCLHHNLPVEARLGLMRQVCGAVEQAHRNLVVHRDLKPGNILVTAGGTVKLLDFGIAKLLEPAAGTETLTRMGLVPMTPDYASPEQILGEPVTTLSDVYSLGVVLYELLTGQRPHDRRGSPAEVLAKVAREGAPTAPGKALREAPTARTEVLGPRPASDSPERRSASGFEESVAGGDLDRIVLKAIDRDPARRYGSAAALSKDLSRYLRHEPVEATSPSAAYRFRKLVQRRRGAFAAGVLLLFALIGGFFARSLEARRANRAAAEALRERQAAQEVSDFLVRMLESTNPSKVGREVKVVDILGPAAEGLAEGFEDQPEVRATLHTTLARTYDSLSLWSEAETHYRAGLELDRLHRGAMAPETQFGTLRLAGLLNRTGRYEEAGALAESFWQRLRGELGDSDLRTLDAQMTWAQSLDWLEREEESIALMKDVARKVETHYPERPDLLLMTNYDLGLVYRNGDRLEAAAEHYRGVLEQARQAHGPAAFLTLKIQSQLGIALSELGRHEEGHAVLRDALERLGSDPERDFDRSFLLNSLGLGLELWGKLGESEAAYREAIVLADRLVGPASEDSLMARRNLVDVLYRQGRLEEALALEEGAGEARDRLTGPLHYRALDGRLRQAELLIRLGRLEEGEALLQEVEERFDRVENRHGAPYFESVLGLLRLRQGRYGESEEHLQSAFDGLGKRRGLAAYNLRLTAAALVEFYLETGRPEAAEALKAEVGGADFLPRLPELEGD